MNRLLLAFCTLFACSVLVGESGVRILTLDVDTQMGAGHLDALNSQFLASPRGGSCIR